MTNEKAIQLLHRLSDEQFDGPHGDERREALEMAVRALEGDSDTIYRQQAIDAHCELCPDKYICCPVRNGNICPDYEVFRLLPSAQPERKTGKWIDNDKINFPQCSECGMWIDVMQQSGEMNFCPNCGADMRGENDE